MFGGCAKQIAEAAKDMRTYGITLVCRHQHTIQPLAFKYIEMIEPEVDHDLFELARTVNCTRQSGGRRLFGDLHDELPAFLFALFRVLLGFLFRCAKLDNHVTGRLVDRGQIVQFPGKRLRQRDVLRMKLFVDIAVYADFIYAGDIDSVGTIGNPVQDMQLTLLCRQPRRP